MTHILIVEDEVVIAKALKRLLEKHNYEVVAVYSVGEAEESIRRQRFELVIADLRLPDGLGTDVIRSLGDVPVLIMTSYASVSSAVDSMKKGAVDYIPKPFDHKDVVARVEGIVSRRGRDEAVAAGRPRQDQASAVGGMVGDSAAMRNVFETIAKVAPTDCTVLILGESGTGKELVARSIHRGSRRRDTPLITLNCAAIPEGLIESELFGHEKGAFTGAHVRRQGLVEAADGGTLFLDEIGELPQSAQARLLRFLQEGEIRRVGSVQSQRVNVRLLAATHRDLKELVAQKKFRGDLYFRLKVVELRVSPLRERGEDAVKLADSFLVKAAKAFGKPVMRFTPDALAAISTYSWPGNVRELENAIERGAVLAEAEEITRDALDIERHEPEGAASTETGVSMEEYFRNFVLRHQNDLTETELAKRLGMSRKALWERRRRLGVPRPKRK